MHIIYIIVYSIIMYFIQPVIWVLLLWRSKGIASYRKCWLERYGLCNKFVKPNGIIIHAVSLGEMLSAMPLICALQYRYPDIVITLTSMTPTGMELARSNSIDSINICCRYFPYDLPGVMSRFINQIQPKLVIVMETELWPNFINILYRRNIPFVLVNARMSLRSFLKYKKISCFIASIMNQITLIAAQNKEDAARFISLGFKKNRLFITGNLKFNIEVTQDLFKKVLFLKNAWIRNRKVWIASSTHSGEEILLLQAHKKLLQIFPDLLMILAPRHPERFFYVQNITEKIGFSYILKSSGLIPKKETQVVINDTIGELMLLYGIANIAFVGGSLVKHGGHNPLEPAAHGIPVLMGPYTFNFNDICDKLIKAGGLIIVTDIISIVEIVSMLLWDERLCLDYGDRAIKVFKNNQGALQQLLCLLEKMM